MNRKFLFLGIAASEFILWAIFTFVYNSRFSYRILIVPYVGIISLVLAFLANHWAKKKNKQLVFYIVFVVWLIFLNAWTIREYFWYR